MEIELEVTASVAIQRKKPWSRFAWLKEARGSAASSGLFLLDNTRISQLSLATGKTRRNFPTLASVQSELVRTCTSHSGSVLAGLTLQGHLFVWLQPSRHLTIYTTPLSAPPSIPPSAPSLLPEHLKGCHVFVSDSGEQALLVTGALDLHLWELREDIYSEWWQLPAPPSLRLPRGPHSRQTAVDACFFVHQVLGECCQCNIVFTDQETKETVIAHCLLTWKQTPHDSHASESTSQTAQEHNKREKSDARGVQGSRATNPLMDRTNLDQSTPSNSNVCSQPSRDNLTTCTSSSDLTGHIPVHATWKTCTVPGSDLVSAPRGRGCYVARLSPTARLTAVAVNHENAADTHVLFVDLLTEASLSSPVYTNRDDVMTGRTFWITSLAWSGDGLLLAAMTRRGCLMLLPRFGPPLKLVTTGCGLDMGPARFLPLHPLITVQTRKSLNVTDHETSESSERDALRQRFSVTCHPRLPLLLCSDGYCLTVLSLHTAYSSLPQLVCGIANSCRSILGLAEIQHQELDSAVPHSHAASREALPPESDMRAVELPTSEHTRSKQKQSHVHGVANSEEVFTASLTLPRAGYFPTVEAGKVCFAGMDDSHGLAHTQNLGQVSSENKAQLARASLLAAWGLLLSAGEFQPGNGLYPSRLNANRIKPISSAMSIAKSVVVTTLAMFPSPPFHTTSNRRQLQECVVSALSLAYVDKLDQCHHRLVYKLANTALTSILSRLLQAHKDFASGSNHTLASVETYAKFITTCLQHFWNSFQRIVMLVTGLYSQAPSKSRKVFSLPLLILARLSNILSSDLLSCSELTQMALTPDLESSALHNREVGLLQGRVSQSIDDAAALLEGVRNTLAAYFSHGLSTMTVLTSLNRKERVTSLTSGVNNLADCQELSDMFPLLLQMLEKCHLKQALDLVHSLLVPQSDAGATQGAPVCHASVPGLVLASPAGLAGFSTTYPYLNTLLLTVARFMTAFFCSRMTGIVRCLIPTSPNASPPRCHPSQRHLEAQSERITLSICEQSLSDKWTPTHAVELYLLGGRWYEAAKLTARMGDWKKSLLLCIVHVMYRRLLAEEHHIDSSATVELAKVERFAHWLAVGKISRALGLSAGPQTPRPAQHQTKPDLPYIASIVSVCGQGGLSNVGPDVSFLLLHRVWRAARRLPVRVPHAVHLPAPPLYCPQPSMNEARLHNASTGLAHGVEEPVLRQTLSRLVQAHRSMLQACGCLELCHRWYTSALVALHRDTASHATRLRHMPSADGSITGVDMPHSLREIATGEVVLQELSHTEQCQLAMFRELCGLLWLLHVRDNASLRLRQVFHSTPLNQAEQTAVHAAAECALWCARLLPLRKCLAQDNAAEVPDMLLSAIAELPCDPLMATLLALCFPDSRQFTSRGRCLQLKMDRLLARMRSTVVEGGQGKPHPLSVDYQVMSRAVLEDQSSSVRECFSPQCFQSGSELTLSGDALAVGMHIFEYDQGYLDFLDTLFSITYANNSTQLRVYSPTFQHSFPPCYTYTGSSRLQHSVPSHTAEDGGTCWERVQTQAASLYEWTQCVDSSTHSDQVTRSASQPSRAEEREGSNRRGKSKVNTPTMRIDLSLSFLMYCLQLEEEKCRRAPNTDNIHVSTSTLHAVTGTQSDGGDSITTITSVLDGTASAITTITTDIDSTASSGSTLYAEDLTTSPRGQPAPLAIGGHSVPPRLELEEINAASSHFGQHLYPLLQIPHDIFNVHVQEQEEFPQQPQPAAGDSALSVSLSSTSSFTAPSLQTSSLQLGPSLDLDMSESQSAGELPSQLTFSIGEFGTAVSPNSTTETFQPLQTTPPASPSSSSAEDMSALQDVGCVHAHTLQHARESDDASSGSELVVAEHVTVEQDGEVEHCREDGGGIEEELDGGEGGGNKGGESEGVSRGGGEEGGGGGEGECEGNGGGWKVGEGAEHDGGGGMEGGDSGESEDELSRRCGENSESDKEHGEQGAGEDVSALLAGERGSTQDTHPRESGQSPLPSDGTEPHAPLPSDGTEPRTPLPSDGTETHAPLPSYGEEPRTPLPSDGTEPHAPLPSDGTEPHAPLPSDGTEPHAPLPSDGTEPHAPLPSDGAEPHAPLPSDGTEPHAPLPSDGTEPHAPLPSDGTEPHAAPAAQQSTVGLPPNSTSLLAPLANKENRDKPNTQDHLLDPVSSQQLVPDSRQVRVAANDRDQPLHAAGERGEVQDRRNQTTDISRIVKSEMKKFLQAQHQQLMQLLEETNSSREADGQEMTRAGTTTARQRDTAAHDAANTHHTAPLPAAQSQDHRQATGDSVSDRQNSVSGDLSVRHPHQQHTASPLPPPPLLTDLLQPLLTNLPQPVHQPMEPRPEYAQNATSENTAMNPECFGLRLLHIDHDACHYDDATMTTRDQTFVGANSTARQSEIKPGTSEGVPLLTLRNTEKERAILPSIAPVPRPHTTVTATVSAAPEHTSLPLLQCQPPGCGVIPPARRVDTDIGMTLPASSNVQVPLGLPNIPTVTWIRQTAPMQPVRVSQPLLVLPEEKLSSLPPPLPLLLPPPPTLLLPPPPPPLTRYTQFKVPRVPGQSQPLQLLPANTVFPNKPLPLLQMGDPVQGIPQANLELLQLPEQSDLPLHHVLLMQPTAQDDAASSSSSRESSSQARYKRPHAHNRQRKQRKKRRTEAEKPSQSPPLQHGPSPTAITREETHETKNDKRSLAQHSQDNTVGGLALATSGQIHEISPASEPLHMRQTKMHTAFLPGDHNHEDTGNNEQQPAPQQPAPRPSVATPTPGVPGSESEGALLSQPSGQTVDSCVQAVISPHPLPTRPRAVSDRVGRGVGRQFIRITDIETDDGGSLSSSGDESSEYTHLSEAYTNVANVPRETERGESSPCEGLRGSGVGLREGGGGEGEDVGSGGVEGEGVGYEGGHKREHEHPVAREQVDSRLHHHYERTETRDEEGRTFARTEVLRQLQQLERQLSAIESTARTVQGELLASNQLLGTIDELQAVGETPSVPVPVSAGPVHTSQPTAPRDHAGTASVHVSNVGGVSHFPTQLVSLKPPPAVGTQYGVNVAGRVSRGTLPRGQVHFSDAKQPPRSISYQDESSSSSSSNALLPEGGQCGKEKLKRLLTAQRREQQTSTSWETQATHRPAHHSQMAPALSVEGETRRSQSQEHRARRLEDAFSLMKDILSSDPHSTQPASTRHVRTPSASTRHVRTPHTRALASSARSTSTTENVSTYRHTGNRVPGQGSGTGRKRMHSSEAAHKFADTTHPHTLPTRHLGSQDTTSATRQGMRCCSSVEGLTPQEQIRMAQIMVSTELSSMSSGSVASHIDWDLVDHLIDD